ncbi:PilT/PilU family type 4a pilus ATPase [Patescibacteria group bacterium]|nr:PilT/PilU family type 4a pilus ATPase [Patescibacteria group bacterium]MBU1683397.1 PilT/PilU family type 4a pilus ATPase [Patescibacteria group bacterium]
MNPNITKIFDLAVNRNASDIHFQTGKKPVIRINGKLYLVDDAEIFQLMENTPEFQELINKEQQKYFVENGNVDFAFTYDNDYRFRGNVYRQQNGLSLSLRIIRNRILSFEQLNLPPIFKDIAENYRQGFFLVVGPTGQGKTTSMAAILSHINKHREEHIVTIEDPIEYIIQNEKSIIEQREVGLHTSSFQSALRSSMRQDPDIIIIGEMRDQETMQAALTLAETGHLVFSTMHTNNAPQTIDRIIDAFPEHKQKQIRIQLASTLTGVISQRLIPGVKDELVYAYEQLLTTDAVRNIIRTEKIEQIYNALQTDEESGFIRLEKCLAELVKEEKISKENALAFSTSRELVDMFLELQPA